MVATTRLMQGSFTGGELAPSLWARVDLQKYQTGLKVAKNVFIHAHGGASNRPGLEYLGAASNQNQPVRLIPFEFNDAAQVYILEFGHQYMRVWKNGGLIIRPGDTILSIATPYDGAHVGDLSFAQENDVIYLAHPLYAPRKVSRGRWEDPAATFTTTGNEYDWAMEVVDFLIDTKRPTGLVAVANYTTPTKKTSDSASVEVKVVSVDSAGRKSAASSAATATNFYYEDPAGSYVKVTWTEKANAVEYWIYKTNATAGLLGKVVDGEGKKNSFEARGIGVDITQTAPASADVGATAATPTGVNASVQFGKPMRYRVSAVREDTGEESLATPAVTVYNDLRYNNNYNTLRWAAPAGETIAYYNVYKEENGLFGYIGRTDDLTFTDDNIAPDTSQAPQEQKNPFNGTGKYPRTVAFHEGRLWWGGTRKQPMAIWGSPTANYESMATSFPLKATDRVLFRTRGQTVNEVRAMVSHRALMVFTSGGVYSLTGGDENFISPSNIWPKEETNRGASRVPPIKVGETVIYNISRGGVIRDLAYDFGQDAFAGSDLTIMARHLFDGREVKAWTYAESPYSILWVILDNGSLLSLTYLKDHEVWAWCRHESARGDTAGATAIFESCATVNEGGQDRVYFVVRRLINGSWKRYIERFYPRYMNNQSLSNSRFLDCATVYDGRGIGPGGSDVKVTSVSGLSYLAGQTVNVLADGQVYKDRPVSGGSVTIPKAAALICVGLGYVSEIEALEIDIGPVRGLGMVQGRFKSIAKVTLRVEATRGLSIGYDRDHMNEYKQRGEEDWGEATRLFTGDIELGTDPYWQQNGSFVVQQTNPLPMNVLAAFPDYAIGG